MINLVRVALRRPYTMAVTALLIMLMGAISVTRMIVDIFPNIDIPVVYVAWSYNGLNAEDMERRVVLVSERAYSTTVNGIERIESLSIPGQGILKIYFQQGADIGAAIAQISAQSNAVLRIAPPGHAAAEHHPVQRVERSGGAGHAEQPHARRAVALGLRKPVFASAAVYDPRALDTGRVWRQEPADHRRGR